MKSFEEIIDCLNKHWSNIGCVLMHSHTTEIAAGTLHPSTVINTLKKKQWKSAYVQQSIRPGDFRFANSPNRLYKHHQYQVILKPSPDNLQELYLNSLVDLGLDVRENDIKFIKDDWKNPSIGAHGLGWEIRLNGMEVSQFTYMQKIGGIDCVAGELAYGLERIAMHIQEVDSVYDIVWNKDNVKYKDLFFNNEQSFSSYSSEHADIEYLISDFKKIQEICDSLAEKNIPEVAYDYCLKACHILNILESRKGLSTTEQNQYMTKVRNMVKNCCRCFVN